ncbi:MAG TPA: tetratricopeptide repeat protein [bacterium]|nr:tetratricopeptide repeat protein [bacterium]
MAKAASEREFYATCVGVFALAVGLRLVYLAHLRALPFFDHPIMDAAYHDNWAREIMSGKPVAAEPFFRAPLYPYFLALTYLVSKGSYLVPRLVQFVLGGLTAVITFALARSYFGRLAGLVAGLLAATYPVLIYFDGELLTETLYIFLSVAGLGLLEIARRRQALVAWLASGLALGLALATRPNLALFLPVAAVGAAVFARRRVAATVLLVVGCIVPLAPVTIHNFEASGEFIPLVWQGGINFYLGNNASANGWSATSPEIRKDWWGGYNDMVAIPREALGRQPSFNEVSSYWTDKAMSFIKAHPVQWSRLVLKKVALFWGSKEFPNNQDYNFMKLYSWVLRNPIGGFGTVAPLALLGVFLFLRDFRRLYFIYGLLVTSFVGTVVFFVCDRYRLPAVPLMIAFAGGTLSYLVGLVLKKEMIRLAPCLACLAGAALVVNINLAGERLPDFAQSYCGLGKAYAAMGKTEEAFRDLEKAVAVNPAWAEAYEQMGLLKMQAGETKAAEAYLLKAAQTWPDYATPYRALAMIYLADGKVTEARQAIDQALKLAPFLEDAHNVLGSVLIKEGKPEEAISAFNRELEVNPESWRAYANLGSAYAEAGKIEQAIGAYEKAISKNPDNSEAMLTLATLYAKAGNNDAAQQLLKRVKPGPSGDLSLTYNRAVILQQSGNLDEAGRIYEDILKQDRFHEGALVNLGVIYAKQGRTQDAVDLWQRALVVNPSNQTVKRNLELIKEHQR